MMKSFLCQCCLSLMVFTLTVAHVPSDQADHLKDLRQILHRPASGLSVCLHVASPSSVNTCWSTCLSPSQRWPHAPDQLGPVSDPSRPTCIFYFLQIAVSVESTCRTNGPSHTCPTGFDELIVSFVFPPVCHTCCQKRQWNILSLFLFLQFCIYHWFWGWNVEDKGI